MSRTRRRPRWRGQTVRLATWGVDGDEGADASGERIERGKQAQVGQDGRVDSGREGQQFGQRAGDLLVGVGEEEVVDWLVLDEVQRDPDREQPLLRAVVEIGLEPDSCLVGRLDEGCLGQNSTPTIPGALEGATVRVSSYRLIFV